MSIFFIIFCFINLCSCSKVNTSYASTIDDAVCYEIENLENYNTLNDETIKTLSVLYRSKFLKEKNYKNYEYSYPKNHIRDIVEETKDKIIKENKTATYKKEDVYTWKKTIKKADLLKFLYKNNISVANISKIKPIYNEENNISQIDIGGKIINFDLLKNFFNLESNKIKDVKVKNNEIIIIGIGKDETNTVSVKEIEEYSSSGKTYLDILNYYYPGYEIY